MRIRTNSRTLVFSILAGLLTGISTPLFAQPGSVRDSNFIYDHPIVAHLDSLAHSVFFAGAKTSVGRDALNVYHFSPDSVPVYTDSVYRARIEMLNLHSPFQYVYNDQTKAYIELYVNKKRKMSARIMGLAQLYFPIFEEQLDIFNIPQELKYLAIIESALNPIAKSRVGASGLWQFMFTTGKMYNMEVTSYVDDRFDPYKSTIAACRLLRDLYKVYNDWALVLAAYNAGPGSVNRAIRNAHLGPDQRVTYWNIRPWLPKETQGYVPAFIGASYMMAYGTEHNIFPVAPDFTYHDIDTVTIRQPLKFSQLSAYLCIPLEQVQFLNPAYKTGFIPASASKPYVLRLPGKVMADFTNNAESVFAYKSPAEIQAEKDLAAAGTITPPAPAAAANNTQTASANTANQPAVGATTTAATTESTPKPTPPKSLSGDKYVVHTVQRGDSLWSIAGKYKSTVDGIRKLNNLNTAGTIYPGQKLKVAVTG